MRSWRSEILSLITVLSVPAMLAMVFPYSALGFRAAQPRTSVRGFSAMVRLSPAAEAEAIRAAKTSWRGESGVLRSDLLLGELPAPDASPVLAIGARNRPAPSPESEIAVPPFMPSLAAPPPVRLPADGVIAPEPAFSRQDLLEIH